VDSISIQDWGAIGEIAGGLGVIFTLLYLATQIRQNTKHVASASLQAMSQRVEDRMMAVATNSQFANVFRRWRDGEEMTEDELVQAANWFSSWVSDVQDGYRQVRLGVIDEAVLRGRIMSVGTMMRSPHAQAQWDSLKNFTDPVFAEWLENEIRKMEST
jgi:hypothetical protein